MSSVDSDPWREDIRRRMDSIFASMEKEFQDQLQGFNETLQPLVDQKKALVERLHGEIKEAEQQIILAENRMAAADAACLNIIEESKRLMESQFELECRREMQRQKWVQAIPDIPDWVAPDNESLRVIGFLKGSGSCKESLEEEQRKDEEREELKIRLAKTATKELKQLLDSKRSSSEVTLSEPPVAIPVAGAPSLKKKRI
ncbi:hypothetical protein CVT24_008219 [Panaeolus cyanescens]|uniref:Dynein regulatory complex protein 1/2 N-terminal domain-containing protein n=1 Tax=Panaeolus cyanescens TaxID=181874 RepID=A0A409VF28_9AGAR|nr:hypothetical protein CVT24_008219 [Panaeolus cyanescens]